MSNQTKISLRDGSNEESSGQTSGNEKSIGKNKGNSKISEWLKPEPEVIEETLNKKCHIQI